MDYEEFPYIIGWELTLACNLRCAHCGSSAGEARGRELTLAEAQNICDQLPDLLVQEVDFTGGEPLLSPNLTKIGARLQKLGIPFKLITNGDLLSPELIWQLQEAGLSGLGISLDGLPPTHDRIRGKPGLFDHIRSQINEIHQANIPLTIITTVNSQNIKELPDLMGIMVKEGIHSWQIQPFFPLGRGVKNDWLRLSEQDYLRLGDFIFQSNDWIAQRGLEIMPADSCGYFTSRDQRDPAWHGCPAGLFACGITSDGQIKGCLSMPDELIEGSLKERELWDIWFDSQAFIYNRQYISANLGNNCTGCQFGEQCRGGCSAMSYGCTGKFHNDPLCFYRIEGHNLS
jgi:radical SAM protein with 4Fe4S-binding SPASM domain